MLKVGKLGQLVDTRLGFDITKGLQMDSVVDVASTGVSYDNDDVVVDDTIGGVVLLAANAGRKSALIINTGAEPIRVTTDGSAPTSVRGKLLIAGASLALTSPYCPTSEIKAIRQDAVDSSANASEVD
jgi:hypothetical protein